ACHSGSWPGARTHWVKTSRGHGLGTHSVNREDDILPHIVTPVLARGPGGKIGPHRLVWPAFWARLQGDTLTPIIPDAIKAVADKILTDKKYSRFSDWPELDEPKVVQVLNVLANDHSAGEPVYICGGKLYRLNTSGGLDDQDHAGARPYLWPMAHDVRGAQQALGVRGCDDCHTSDSAFFFGDVVVDSPLEAMGADAKSMIEFLELDPLYIKGFNMSFVFRPWMKITVLGACGVIAIILLLYSFRAIEYITKKAIEAKP
ncbi:MAG: hypothetical protein JW860_09400, partial [Sedimentisphaerales bacterium]|nr:hypothetical protein [Sedimentisphaerales bacterium]